MEVFLSFGSIDSASVHEEGEMFLGELGLWDFRMWCMYMCINVWIVWVLWICDLGLGLGLC